MYVLEWVKCVNANRIVNIANGITSVELLEVVLLIQKNFHSLDVLKYTYIYISLTILENSKYHICPHTEAVTVILLTFLVNIDIYRLAHEMSYHFIIPLKL